MSTPQPLPAAEAPPSFAMIRTLGGVAMISGFLVVLVFQFTQPYIAANESRAIERAVFQVVPGAVSRKDFTVTESALLPGDRPDKGIPVYAAYGSDGSLKGIAAEASAQGYQDAIHLLYGYDPKCQCITGINVLQMQETPGLGDQITKNADFLANFKALDATVDRAKHALANAIRTVKHGTKTHPWQIDAISGATISSTAVGKALDTSAEKLLPRLLPHIAELTEAQTPTDAKTRKAP